MFDTNGTNRPRLRGSYSSAHLCRCSAQLRKLDEVIKKTDQLLYQMIPKAVAERLRSGSIH